MVREHIHQVEVTRKEALRSSHDPAIEQVRRLLQLKGIGMNSSWLYVMEFFAWRNFQNRREVGALASLTPTPYQSGENAQEQGISKAGNRQIRAMAIRDRLGLVTFPTRERAKPLVSGAFCKRQ